MPNLTLPDREMELIQWGDNFASFIGTDYADYGLTADQAQRFLDALGAWKSAFARANESSTRTRPAVAAKNDELKRFRKLAMQTVSIVRGFEGINDELLLQLGIRPTPSTTASSQTPREMMIQVNGVEANRVSLTLLVNGESGTTHRRGVGHAGATLLFHIGPTPPIELSGWSLADQTTLRKTSLTFPAGTPAGTLVWIAGFFVNARFERGALSLPVSIHLGYSGASTTVPARHAA